MHYETLTAMLGFFYALFFRYIDGAESFLVRLRETEPARFTTIGRAKRQSVTSTLKKSHIYPFKKRHLPIFAT